METEEYYGGLYPEPPEIEEIDYEEDNDEIDRYYDDMQLGLL